MARSTPLVTVTCDRCGKSIEVECVALAYDGTWDAGEELDDVLVDTEGWRVDEERFDFCEECKDDDDDE